MSHLEIEEERYREHREDVRRAVAAAARVVASGEGGREDTRPPGRRVESAAATILDWMTKQR